MWCCYEYIYMLKNTCTFNPSKTSYFSHFDNHIIDYIIFNIIQNLTNKIFLFISKLTNEFAEHITFLVDTKSVPNSLPDKNTAYTEPLVVACQIVEQAIIKCANNIAGKGVLYCKCG